MQRFGSNGFVPQPAVPIPGQFAPMFPCPPNPYPMPSNFPPNMGFPIPMPANQQQMYPGPNVQNVMPPAAAAAAALLQAQAQVQAQVQAQTQNTGPYDNQWGSGSTNSNGSRSGPEQVIKKVSPRRQSQQKYPWNKNKFNKKQGEAETNGRHQGFAKRTQNGPHRRAQSLSPELKLGKLGDLNEDSSSSRGGRRSTIGHAPAHYRDRKKNQTNNPKARANSSQKTAGDTNANVDGAKTGGNENENNASTNSGAVTPATDNEELDDADVSEDGDEKVDYVSRLTQLTQKSANLGLVTYSYEEASSVMKHRWRCVARAKILVGNQTNEVIERAGMGRTRKLSKQKVSYLMLGAIEAYKKEWEITKSINGTKKDVDKGNAKDTNNDAANVDEDDPNALEGDIPDVCVLREAISILESMWQNGHLKSPAHYTYKQIQNDNPCVWECHGIVKLSEVNDSNQQKDGENQATTENGEVRSSAKSSNKKTAKQLTALRIVKRLGEMNARGMAAYEAMENGEALSVPISARVSGLGSGLGSGHDRKLRSEIINNAKSNSSGVVDVSAEKDIVQMSDDEKSEGSVSSIELGREDCPVELPNGFNLLIARTEEQVDHWLSDYVELNSRIGVYVDSNMARRAVEEDVYQASDKTLSEMRTKKLDWPLIALTTGMTCLVLCQKWRTDHPDSDGINDGDTGKGEYWIPDSLAEVFECSTVVKNGLFTSWGTRSWNLQCRKFGDVSCESVAISGVCRVDGTPWERSLRALASQWLHRRLPARNTSLIDVWGDQADIPKFARQICSDSPGLSSDVTRAVLSAYVCYCLPKEWNKNAKQKRTALYGTAAEFDDLANKLTMSPRVLVDQHRYD